MTSHPEYDQHTTGTEVAKVFAHRIKGRTFLITGVSPKSIGCSTAVALASGHPALLILASRTPAKLAAVSADIHAKYPDVRVETVQLDLASQTSVRSAAAAVAKLTPTLDVLINNAGINVTTRQWTPEGIEMQFGTNHIGHFLLTNLLMPLLTAASGARRVVNVSSAGHRLSPIRFHDYNLEGKEIPPEEMHFTPLPGAFAKCTDDGYNPIVAYSQSKTANILFTVGLQKRLAGTGVAAYAIHPGSIETELSRDQDEELNAQFMKTSLYWRTMDEGASTTLVASLDPALDETKGLYLFDCKFTDPYEWASNPESAEKLWHLSEELVNEKFLST